MNIKEDTMQTSRMILYWTIALLAIATALYMLAQPPSPGWPINLVHLLLKCKP
jgi:hypothetical protein